VRAGAQTRMVAALGRSGMMKRMARTWILASALSVVSLVIAAGCMGARSGPTAAAECRMSQFSVSLGPYVSEATEQHTLALRLVNRGSRTCALDGYPRVRLLDRRGVIPFPIKHGHDQMITTRPPKQVVVRHGGSAFMILNKNTCVNAVSSSVGRSTTVIKVGMLGVPSAAVLRVPRRVPFPWRVPDYCGKGQVGSTIAVSPFEPTVRAALNG
jgi:Protein of unknown function (DUF4232)